LWLVNGLGKPDPLFILPILAGLTQWIQSRMMLSKSTDPQQQMMNSMMNFMPLMIVFFATRYASGLSLYWVTSTVIGILIQYRITGLGLLPETLGGLMNRAGGATAGSSKPSPAPRRTQTSRPASNGASGGQLRDVQPEANGNGSTGGTADGRPRRKANRAKGGKGGRRG
jgi:YidC/Oxa1 family membrane protein insertase